MRTVELGELVAGARVERAGTGDYPVLSMTMHDGLVAQTERFKKRIASLDTSEYKVVRRGQLVVGFPINEGVLDFQMHHEAAVVSPAYGVWDLRDDSHVDRAYLKRFLKSPRAIEYYVGKMKGSTARRRSLPPAEFKAMPIPLPPLPEQRRIASILDHADALRAKRRQVLTHFDALTQSIFAEMFGSTAWDDAALDDVTTISGEYGANLPSVAWAEGLPRYVRITDITESGELNSEVRGPGGVEADWDRYRLADGDILFARSGATVGKTYRHHTSNGDCVFAGYLIRYRPDRAIIDPDFLFGYTKSSRYSRWVSARQNVVAQPNINAKQYGRELPIPLPPLDRQHEYAARAERVMAERDVSLRALSSDDQLFASLQSRAFRGELSA